mmetsp:Transcript_27714/g.46005  ORF Transcript_27714/g.46005 Transcript_27714/m.46005 type:complete len:183 (-) Transcript_27714:236-784(-)|eukprot:CAMPEP_0119010178 /NCGR_PEP_ID=MMETSP1176-20130426/4842_1 /TAXON_ID=265551 /ORGANISM="Synedropsis recta cf, Strain CCMP1620" /LENGTH=182 /DNA_ID=CAMNT_0006962805 /DNA_START=65 /DNA_END=613 /DNA_ORIENTATION=+
MLSRVSLATRALRPAVVARSFTTLENALTADDALKLSGYNSIDYTIKDTATVLDAVHKFAAFNIGCLVTVDESGGMTGILSERDYIGKIALLGRTSKDTAVREISTKSSNLVTAKIDESVEDCMTKMLTSDIRHLPLVGESGEVVGMISIKDLVKTVVSQKERTIRVLSDFALGKGGHYGSE